MTQVHARFDNADDFPGYLSDPVICLAANLRLNVTSILDIGVMPLRCHGDSHLQLNPYSTCYASLIVDTQASRPSNAPFACSLHVTFAMQ